MPIKAALSVAVALLFPLASYVALRLQTPPLWLGAVDFVLTVALLIAVTHDATAPGAARRSLALALAALAGTVLTYHYWPGIMIYLPAIVICGWLARIFHGTLSPGKEPLITRFARIERGGVLPAELADYTRRLTWAWTALFCALFVQSLLLAALASPKTYLLFANCLNYLSVAAFFALEYLYRRVRYRHHPHPSPLHLMKTLAGASVFTEKGRRPHG